MDAIGVHQKVENRFDKTQKAKHQSDIPKLQTGNIKIIQ